MKKTREHRRPQVNLRLTEEQMANIEDIRSRRRPIPPASDVSREALELLVAKEKQRPARQHA